MIRFQFSKRDKNHVEIVRALRAAGRQVIELHALGGGCPDILALWPGGFRLMEIKTAKGRTEASQAVFQESYRGPPGTLVTVRTIRQALAATGVVLPSTSAA